MEDGNLLGPADVAKIIGVTSMTVRRISDKGELPFNVTPGGHRRYRREDVREYCIQKGINIQGEGSHRILIVDDDEQIVSLLSTFIETALPMVDIDVAYGGFEAGLKVKEFMPDVIVTDIVMPDLSGTRMCEMLKQDASTKHIRVIGVTGATDEDEVRTFLNAGAEMCLRKPIKRKTILDALNIES